MDIQRKQLHQEEKESVPSFRVTGKAVLDRALRHGDDSTWPTAPWFLAGLAFSLVALVTVINAIEPFFNWRSRWVLMEEAQYRFYRLEDDLNYLITKSNLEAIQLQDVDALYQRYRLIWDELSLRWLEHRRGGGSGQQEA
jgi:hypothetical protein